MELNDLFNPFHGAVIPLEDWVEGALDWVVHYTRDYFQYVKAPVNNVLVAVESTLKAIPQSLLILVVWLASWQAAGRKTGFLALIFMILIGAIGAWSQAMVTLALVLTSVLFCTILGLPLGIFLARSPVAERIFRPLLDAMQTTPAFVYLVPIVMLFGIGNVPGVLVTIIFALPPLVRLTCLGIRQVPKDVIEASHAFGASPSQLLWKVQLPLAMRTIMAGLNQTLMLALSMVVIASMIAVGGLGQMVLRGIGRLDMGLAAVGGLGIVLLAIVLDRFTQALGTPAKDKGWQSWRDHGPAGFVWKLLNSQSS